MNLGEIVEEGHVLGYKDRTVCFGYALRDGRLVVLRATQDKATSEIETEVLTSEFSPNQRQEARAFYNRQMEVYERAHPTEAQSEIMRCTNGSRAHFYFFQAFRRSA